MSDPAYRTLGLTVPITEVLSPTKWRERYGFGQALGPSAALPEQSAIEGILGCNGSRGQARTAGARGALAEASDALAGAIPDDVIRWHLRAALSELETKLGMPMGVVIVKSTPVDEGLRLGIDYDKEDPRRPFTKGNRDNFYRIDLPAGVISVERVRAYWFSQLVWTIEAGQQSGQMISLEHPGTSSLHLMPVTGVTLQFSQAGAMGVNEYGAMQMMLGYPETIPSVWAVDYTMGPKAKNGGVGQIETVLAHWVCLKAGLLLLSMGGGAATGGLTTASLSIDGLSKSIGLANSALYGLNSASEERFKQAERAIDWERLAVYKRGLRCLKY